MTQCRNQKGDNENMRKITALLLCLLLVLQAFGPQVIFAQLNMSFAEDFEGYEPEQAPSR